VPGLTVPARFCGPPGTANGGWLAGTLAALVDAPTVSVRLRRPVPLERPLAVRTDGAAELYDGAELLARAEPSSLDLGVPALASRPSLPEAAAAVEALPLWEDHPFPGCWGCGPERPAGDGLRTRVGPLPGQPELWAGVWRPTAELPAASGVAAPETVWAALDCPSFMPLTGRTSGPNVLGTITARQDRPVPVDADSVLLAWVLGRDGRRSTTASALVGPDGEVAARAQAVWFALPPSA
jgi:hypothetical protein